MVIVLFDIIDYYVFCILGVFLCGFVEYVIVL